jgi:hypothetical protein
MGHGLMRGGHMMGDQGMMGKQEMPGQQGKTQYNQSEQHRHMMNNVMGMTQDMAIMMRQMSVVMGNITDREGTMSRDRSNRMSALMKDMSAEMNRISDMMGKGTAADEEIRTMQKRMMELQERMWELKR